jgi:hypothetical protein
MNTASRSEEVASRGLRALGTRRVDRRIPRGDIDDLPELRRDRLVEPAKTCPYQSWIPHDVVKLA